MSNQELETFENFIMHCCRLKEWDLRTYLAGKLTEAGFTIQEDTYRSYRGGRYNAVHNMLAMRGKPRICLVAHTDVCRDHSYGESVSVTPVIKTITRYDEEMRVIQDEHCRVQVGGDDRLGVAINTWIALNTGYDLGLLFSTDEEVGNVSSRECNFKELADFELCVQVDRGNHSNQLVIQIGNVRLCDDEMAKTLLNIAKDISLPREPVHGLMTDVLALKRHGKIKAAVNMTCGYHNSIGSNPTEYINIQEAIDTRTYVNEIIKYFDLKDLESSEELPAQIN